MISVFVREQKRYNQAELTKLFQCAEEKTVRVLKRLKEYGIVKAVSGSEVQKNLSNLNDTDVEIASVEIGETEYCYVFSYVGVIAVEGIVLKCYPKYLLRATNPKTELKQVLRVLEKYNSGEQIVRMYNEASTCSSFNILAVTLFLLQDYYDYGSYNNTQDIIETDGTGSILWDKTINETFTLLRNNRPYYIELYTLKHTTDDFDYFKRLHECILSKCSKELQDADLLDLFDILGVDISDESIDDFGDKEYILDRITKELNVQYNTRKQRLLKTLYAYIAHSGTLSDIDSFSMFGTNSFNLVWEKVCADVFDNQLHCPIGGLKLPKPLHGDYEQWRHKELIDVIDKPKWIGSNATGGEYVKTAQDTLIPDIISILGDKFIIFDAKYYNFQMQEDKELRGQPGIESITKQYLYQLAYKDFIASHGFRAVLNCFLMPIEGEEIVAKGKVTLEMLTALGLEPIQVRLLPAGKVYEHYLNQTVFSVESLRID